MTRSPAVVTIALNTTLAAAALGGVGAHAAVRPSAAAHSGTAVTRGAPGSWTKVSTGTVDDILVASMSRSADGVLHVVYPKRVSGGIQIGHTALHTNGTIARQNDVLPGPWANLDRAPVVLSTGAGLRVVFTGIQSTTSGSFWSDGRMYTATGDSAGAGWTLPAEAVGISDQANATYGTGGATLADGTPVAAFGTGDVQLVWHVGTSDGVPDQSFSMPAGASVRNVTLVRDGSAVWAGWYSDGSTAATNGTFAIQIYPSVGTPLKAPGSTGAHTTGRVALAARPGGGVYAAYCVGSPSCTSVRLWRVGTGKTVSVPHSRAATTISLSPGPSGRLWVAWADDLPKVRAVRTGVNGLAMGAVQTAGLPHGASLAFALTVDGTRGRGDLVLNVGDAFWHTQVLPGLTVHANPSSWKHGRRQKVVLSVTDAHSAVNGVKVKVGSSACTTTDGTCSITFPASYPKGRHTARATKHHYAAATTGLRVR